VSAVFFLPIYIALVNAFKPADLIRTDPLRPPLPFTIDNLVRVLTRPDGLFWNSLGTSLLVTSTSIAVVTLLSAMLAYYLSRRAGTASRVAMVVLLMGLMIPTQVILVPVTQVLRALDLMTTLQGLLLFNVGYYVPFGVFVFAGFVRTIPREIDEAAAIDGATGFQTFWRVVFPLLRPATSSVLIFLAVWVWNDFLNPLIILGPASGTTITTGIYRAVGQFSIDYGSMFAMMLLASLPVVAFYLALQSQFIAGLTSGTGKG